MTTVASDRAKLRYELIAWCSPLHNQCPLQRFSGYNRTIRAVTDPHQLKDHIVRKYMNIRIIQVFINNYSVSHNCQYQSLTR